MAGYELDVDLFKGALATATASAVVMPYAWPIVGLISMMNGDPAEQDRGSDQWLNPTSVNSWPTAGPTNALMLTQTQQEWRPPMASNPTPSGGQSDIAFLRSELQRLTREIGASGDWEGQAYASFIERVNVLDGHLDTLDRNRVGCGDTLNSSAQGYHAILMFCVAVAGVLGALAIFVTAARASVVGAAPGEASAMSAVTGLHTTVSTVFKQHWKLVLKVSLILAAAGIAYNQFSKSLPGLQAVSASKPNLVEASTMWDPSKADMVDNPQAEAEAQAAAMEKPSLGPDIGW